MYLGFCSGPTLPLSLERHLWHPLDYPPVPWWQLEWLGSARERNGGCYVHLPSRVNGLVTMRETQADQVLYGYPDRCREPVNYQLRDPILSEPP